MRVAAIIGGVVVIAAVSAFGGYALGRHNNGGSERQRATAHAQEIIGAANDERDGVLGHLVWIGEAAPGIWRFRVKANGEKRYGCHQIILKQFWHGQGTAFHGTGHVDSRLCPPSAGS
jgi:hypothetical protein